MLKHTSHALLVAILFVALTGCPPPGGWPLPPFDTSGAYTGSWTGTSSDQVQNVTECPLELTLTQNLSANYPGDHAVQGTVTVDYSCIELPAWAQDQPQPSTVQVNGILEDNGKLSLLSGGCGTGFCVVLGLAGQGEDTDDDGFLDTYTGDWSYQILLAG